MEDGRLHATVFAPGKRDVKLALGTSRIPMEDQGSGFWSAETGFGDWNQRYGFMVDGKGPYPDPASRFMPEGIDGLSQVVPREIFSRDGGGWRGIPLSEYVIEEIHVGTYTPEGTYRGLEKKLGYLSGLGITALEIMPLAQFYGTRNWGYDGVYLYSPHYGYGSPEDLVHLVDSIHEHGMSVILDVVYNHGGPVGNHLEKYAPFFSHGYSTPWGNCYNLDGEYSDTIREYILENVEYWLGSYRFDGLRLDAVHGIVDHSPVHILREISDRARRISLGTGRNIVITAESDQNDHMLTREPADCGYGIDAQWNDDFHHSLHTVLTGEMEGYYADYGSPEQVGAALSGGFVYQGQYSGYLKRRRGTVWDNPPERLIVCSQNHDQVGNRAHGERLTSLAGDRKARLAALITLLSPYTPLLFMGEEMGATSPFLFFMQSGDESFSESVHEGRRKEFSRFRWGDSTPAPGALSTFNESRIRWDDAGSTRGKSFNSFYRDLIALRKEFVVPHRAGFRSSLGSDLVLRMSYGEEMKVFASLCEEAREVSLDGQQYRCALSSEWRKYGGERDEGKEAGEVLEIPPYSAMVMVSREAASP